MIRTRPLPLGWCLRTSIALGKNCKIWDACASHVTSNCNLSKVEIIYETRIKREVFKTCPLQTGPNPTSTPFLLRFFTPTERISRGSLGVVWNSSWDPPMQKIICVCPYSNINMSCRQNSIAAKRNIFLSFGLKVPFGSPCLAHVCPSNSFGFVFFSRAHITLVVALLFGGLVLLLAFL